MSKAVYPICQGHPGFYSCQGYYHARALKNGTFSLYEGSWVNPSFRKTCSVGYLAAVRSDDGKPRRFSTLEAVSQYITGGRK